MGVLDENEGLLRVFALPGVFYACYRSWEKGEGLTSPGFVGLFPSIPLNRLQVGISERDFLQKETKNDERGDDSE